MKFSGSVTAKLDSKGRVFLPSDFRKQMGESERSLVLKRDVYQPCLVVYPYEIWEAEVDALKMRLNRWDSRQAMVFRQFLASAIQVVPDANGRILLPRRLLETVGIGRVVRFVGVDDRIEVWDDETAERMFMPAANYAAALADLMGGSPDNR